MNNYSIHNVDTRKVPAIKQVPCQCCHECRFSWAPFVLMLLVVMLYLIIITTILIYKLLT